VQDVVTALKFAPSFEREHILGLFDHTQDVVIPQSPANGARAVSGEVEADFTLTNPFLQQVENLRHILGNSGIPKQPIHKTRRGLFSDGGETPELVDRRFDRVINHGA
jgi:hypothetical protein